MTDLQCFKSLVVVMAGTKDSDFSEIQISLVLKTV
jgi:hypothetical protein